MEYHVTSTRNGGVYGHSIEHCNPSGCGVGDADERYLGSQEEIGAERGDVVDLPEAVTDDPEEADVEPDRFEKLAVSDCGYGPEYHARLSAEVHAEQALLWERWLEASRS